MTDTVVLVGGLVVGVVGAWLIYRLLRFDGARERVKSLRLAMVVVLLVTSLMATSLFVLEEGIIHLLVGIATAAAAALVLLAPWQIRE